MSLVEPPPLPYLISRYDLATQMVAYFARTDDMPEVEREARDLILPVGKKLDPDYPTGALQPRTPLEFWSAELTYVLETVEKLLAPPLLLPAHAEDVVLLGPIEPAIATAS